jgi:Transglycosylase SLT domain/D-alanyl-D-alanine carboxypeptidase/Putative Flp pilus-assembly TadE/G-like
MGSEAGLSGPAVAPPLVLVTATGGARGSEALAAALATCTADDRRAAVVVEVGGARIRRPTLLASPAARRGEARLGGTAAGAAARGLLCHVAAGEGEEGLERGVEVVRRCGDWSPCVMHVEAALWQQALGHPGMLAGAALIRAELPRDRSLIALAVRDLRRRGMGVRVAARPLGWAAGRRALAGVRIGGAEGARVRRWAASMRSGVSPDAGAWGASRGPLRAATGQALPAVIGGVAILLIAALAMVSIAGALTGKGRLQRAADLAALSAARSMRDDLPRLTSPPWLPNGAPNPAHMRRATYLSRARDAARGAARANDADPERLKVTFPEARVFPPLRVRVTVQGRLSPPAGGAVSAYAVAEAAPPPGDDGEIPARATGGGYSGPLVYRNGEGMRPDVAAEFDRMAAAASRAGLGLIVNSGFRSDAEQAQLFAQHPDPTWVAPPGHSLHRCATELDLGPPSAYGWLAANAHKFGFLKRYPWEPWHYGYTAGPAPCSAAGDRVGPAGGGDAMGAASQSMPSFVPARFRAALFRAAARWNVSAALLAAQLMAESGFDPYAVSPAGAQGIAQFMPGTAATYGLDDPFDPEAAIDAQAHLMSELLRRFGSVRLALAAYNAGPGAVVACRCVPPFPETVAYVARILALLDGSGALLTPPFEVRLVA